MSRFASYTFEELPLSEAVMLSFSNRSGWVSERKRLSDDELCQLIGQLQHPVLESFGQKKFKTYLNHIFAVFHAQFLQDRIFKADKISPGRPSFIANEIEILLSFYDADKLTEERAGQIQDALSRLNDADKTRSVLYYLDFLRCCAGRDYKRYPSMMEFRRGYIPAEKILEMKDLLIFAQDLARSYVKRGGNGKPNLRQLVVALAYLYKGATGEIPKRHYDTNKEYKGDTGPLIRLTGAMQARIEDHMPDAYRQEVKVPKTICREVAKEMEAESMNA